MSEPHHAVSAMRNVAATVVDKCNIWQSSRSISNNDILHCSNRMSVADRSTDLSESKIWVEKVIM